MRNSSSVNTSSSSSRIDGRKGRGGQRLDDANKAKGPRIETSVGHASHFAGHD